MLDINFLKKSGYFKEIILEKGEILFKEGDIDNNIYIIEIGELSVEKYTTKEKNETKILAYLKKDDVFGEAALNSDKVKQVNIIAQTKTYLIYIDAKKGLDQFTSKFQKEGLNLLKYIIYLSNNRLLESNYLITSTYKISKEIAELNEINNKSIFGIIENLKNALKIDDILYFEINPVIKNYISLKYDTRKPGKLLNEIIEMTDNQLNLLSYKNQGYFSYKQKLSIGINNIGYLIFLKKNKKFNETDKKAFATTSSAIAGLIKQKQLIDEERDKEYMIE